MISLALSFALAGNPTTGIVNDDRDVVQAALVEHFHPYPNEYTPTKPRPYLIWYGEDRKRAKQIREPFKARIDQLVRNQRASANWRIALGPGRTLTPKEKKERIQWAKDDLIIANQFEQIGNRKWAHAAYKPPAPVPFHKMAWTAPIKFIGSTERRFDSSFSLQLPSYSPDGSVAMVQIVQHVYHSSVYTYLMQRQRSGWVTIAAQAIHYV